MAGVRPGFITLEVTVESVEGTYALVRDSLGRPKKVRADVRRGNGPLPRVGEVWLVDQTLGPWTFAACLQSVPPRVIGDAGGVVALESLLSALADSGVIVNEAASLPPAPPMVPTGAYFPFAGSVAPEGFLLAQGQAVSRTDQAALFAVIGTTYGAGNGTTTFNLPDLRQRVPVGRDTTDIDFNAIGKVGGAKDHVLTVDEMPSHTHTQNSHNHTQNAHNHTQNSHNHTQNAHSHTRPYRLQSAGAPMTRSGEAVASANTGDATATLYNAMPPTSSVAATNQATTATNNPTTATNNPTTATNQNTGGGQPHSSMQPYVVANYIIKT